MFSKFLFQKKSILYLVGAIVVYVIFLFFIISYSLPYPLQSPSPDGVANLTFANKIANDHTVLVGIPVDINPQLAQFLIPRSTTYNTSFHAVSMISYYGLPVFLSFFINFFPLHLIYALIAIMGVLSMVYILLKLQLSRPIFFSSVLLFSLNPFFLYYAVNGQMHNLLFINLLLCALALSLWVREKHNNLFFIVPGVVLGFACAVRENEMIWVVPSFFLLFIILEKRLVWKKLLYSVGGFLLGITPFLGMSYKVSHSLTQYKITSTSTFDTSVSLLATLKKYVLPFGFDIKDSFANFYTFAVSVWWLTIPGVLGVLYLLFYYQRRRQKQKLLIIGLVLCIFLFLIMYYGPTATDYYSLPIVIGYSHFRYLLPLFLFLPLFIFFAIDKIPFNRKKVIVPALLMLMLIPSTYYLFFSQSSLQTTRLQNILSEQRLTSYKRIIEPNAVILAGKADKYFFPTWVTAGTIIQSRRNDFVQTLTTSPVAEPVYYYHVNADISSAFTKDALEKAGVKFTYVAQFWDGGNAWEYLYKLDWPNKENNVNQ